MSFLRLAVNTSMYVHCTHPWAQPFGRLTPCKSSILTICYHPLSLRMIVLKSSSKPVGDIMVQTLCPLWRNSQK